MGLIIGILLTTSCKKEEDLSADTKDQLQLENEALKDEVKALTDQVDALRKQLAILQPDQVVEEGASGPVLAGDRAVISEDKKTITVHNARELVFHMQDNVTFLLEEGDYDLSMINDSLNPDYFYYGFKNLKNVVFEGVGSKQVDFMTQEVYYDVLTLNNSNNVTFRNLNLGHNPIVTYSYCSGAVFSFTNSRAITIENCTMFGSGTVGIIANNVVDMKVLESRIYDCSRNIVEFDNVENILFDDCSFENKSDENFQMNNIVNVEVKNSALSGKLSNYPNFIVGDQPLLDLDAQGEKLTLSKEVYGELILDNITLSGYEISSLLEGIYPGITVELYTGISELSGEPYTDCTLVYAKQPDESLYLSHIEQAKKIIAENYEVPSYNIYVNLSFEDSESWGVSSYWDGRVSLSTNYTNLNAVLGNDILYLTKEEATAMLIEKLPKQRIIGSKEVRDYWQEGTLVLADTIIYEGQVYYTYYTDEQDFYFWRDVSINAATGAVYVWFDGTSFTKVRETNEQEIGAILDFYRSEGIDPSDGDTYIAIGVGSDQVILMNNFGGYDALTVTETGGMYTASYYSEYYGD